MNRNHMGLRMLQLALSCFAVLLLTGWTSRLWATWVLAQHDTASATPTQEEIQPSRNAERQSDTGEDVPRSSGWVRFLSWMSGTSGDPVEVLGHMLPGVQRTAEGEVEDEGGTEDIQENEQEDSVVRIEVGDIQPVVPIFEGLPTVFIYHTHTHEAYDPLGGAAYKESTGKYRTPDTSFNIVKVGEELSALLQQRGFPIEHNTTDHEPPVLGTAYSRSLKTLEKRIAENPELDVFIDLHRDAYSSSKPRAVEVNGESVAQIMLVIGTGEGSTGNGFVQKPKWEENLKLAQALTNELQKIAPDLARPVMIKTGRYNQHVSTNAILIEVGHNRNTLEEALASLPYLADALAKVLATP